MTSHEIKKLFMNTGFLHLHEHTAACINSFHIAALPTISSFFYVVVSGSNKHTFYFCAKLNYEKRKADIVYSV